MFLRQMIRKKDGKEHRYFSVVENKRVAGGRVIQRSVLYLGEINDTQELAWRKSIEVFDEGAARPRTLSLFPEDRCEGLLPDASIVRLKLSQMRAAIKCLHIPQGSSLRFGLSALSATAVGRVLADSDAVAGTASRSVLGETIAGEPQGHALGSSAICAGGVPAGGPWQRMAVAPRVVRAHCAAGFAGG